MQDMDSNILGVQETDDPLHLSIVNQNENANEVFYPLHHPNYKGSTQGRFATYLKRKTYVLIKTNSSKL